MRAARRYLMHAVKAEREEINFALRKYTANGCDRTVARDDFIADGQRLDCAPAVRSSDFRPVFKGLPHAIRAECEPLFDFGTECEELEVFCVELTAQRAGVRVVRADAVASGALTAAFLQLDCQHRPC